jgi:hypothetical protein
LTPNSKLKVFLLLGSFSSSLLAIFLIDSITRKEDAMGRNVVEGNSVGDVRGEACR